MQRCGLRYVFCRKLLILTCNIGTKITLNSNMQEKKKLFLVQPHLKLYLRAIKILRANLPNINFFFIHKDEISDVNNNQIIPLSAEKGFYFVDEVFHQLKHLFFIFPPRSFKNFTFSPTNSNVFIRSIHSKP